LIPTLSFHKTKSQIETRCKSYRSEISISASIDFIVVSKSKQVYMWPTLRTYLGRIDVECQAVLRSHNIFRQRDTKKLETHGSSSLGWSDLSYPWSFWDRSLSFKCKFFIMFLCLLTLKTFAIMHIDDLHWFLRKFALYTCLLSHTKHCHTILTNPLR